MFVLSPEAVTAVFDGILKVMFAVPLVVALLGMLWFTYKAIIQ